MVIVWLYVFVLGLAGCYYVLLTQSPEVRQYIDYRQSIPVETPVWYESISNGVNRSKFAADIAVFAIWSLVGILLYAVAEVVLRFVARTWRLEHELLNKFTNRAQLLTQTAAGAGLWLLGIGLFAITFFVLTPLFLSFLSPRLSYLQSSVWDMIVFIGVYLTASVVISYMIGISIRFILRRIRVF